MHEGFHDFTKDYLSGRTSLTDTSLQNTTALDRTLEQPFEKKVHLTRNREARRPRAHRAGGATPDNESVDVTSGPLSRGQVDALFNNFKCPLHRVNNRTCAECFAYSDHGFSVTKQAAGVSRRVTSPDTDFIDETPSPPPESPALATADAPAPTPDETPESSADTVLGSGHRVFNVFDAVDELQDDDDDVSVASTVDDFGFDYVIGSSRRVTVDRSHTVASHQAPKVFAPYRRTPPLTLDC